MKVTVLTTLYNKGPYVEEALRSALDNTFTDLEVLVVDDHSTDDGMERVRRMDDPRIRIVSNPENLGRAGAANRGFDEARGEYIAILDADDIMLPERIARQVAFLDAHPEVGALGTYAQAFGSGDDISTWPADDATCRAHMLFSDPVLYGSAMFRRAVIEQHGLRCDPSWRHPGMDYLFTISLAPYTRYANLQEPLLLYRIGEQNMRHDRDPVADRGRVYHEVFRRLGISVTDEQVELQLMLHKLFRQPPTAAHIHALHRWIGDLMRLVEERALFDPELFRQEVMRRWDRLFHALADRDTGAALAHLRLGRDLRPARWRYLAATAMRRKRTAIQRA